MNKITNSIPYIAGYIDGDGCFYVGKTIQKPKMIVAFEYSIQIVSVKRDILNVFRNYFGGCIRKKPFKKLHRDAFCWTIKGQESISLTKQILPFMVDKAYQGEIFVQFAKLIFRNNFKTVKNSLLNERNRLINLIREDKHMNNLITQEDIEGPKEKANTITPSSVDYPYLAGLIDSEGCFRIKKWKPKKRPNPVYNINLEIGNTKLPLMPWLIERFGGSVVFIPAKANKKAAAIWTLSAAALYEILPKIRPFLTNKQIVCDKLIEFQKTILPNGGDRHSELFRALFEKRREIREKIISEIHKLNHKGSH